jgi:hypothetical protein
MIKKVREFRIKVTKENGGIGIRDQFSAQVARRICKMAALPFVGPFAQQVS